MGDEGVFATTAEVVRKAGANASATAIASEAITNDLIAQAESEINALTRVNWSDLYGTLNVDVKALLKEAGTNLAGMYIVAYDMSGYTSRQEATTILDMLRDAYLRALGGLREIQIQKFVKGA